MDGSGNIARNNPSPLTRCVEEVTKRSPCSRQLDSHDIKRIISLKIALDVRYQTWPDSWGRLEQTIACVNRFFRPTGIQWLVSDVSPWNPGKDRHQLYRLLRRARAEIPADQQSLRVGITVWEERKIYASAGGEIGLSQNGVCVVPSWPRIENDCLILTHELGHLIGAKHVPGKHWIMGWAARPFHLPSRNPLARIRAIYQLHPRNRLAIGAYADADLRAHGLVPSFACRQYITEIDRCYGF